MKIGIPKEIKSQENRVAMTPGGVQELVAHGHEVWVEKDAGIGAGFSDNEYDKAGAKIVETAAEVFKAATLIVKVKEPLKSEWPLIQSHHCLFTYLHLAPNRPLTEALLKSGCIAIAYETVTDAQGSLPLLTPMSEVAGRLSIQAGAHYLEKSAGGRGVLLGGVPGVKPGKVAVLGGGVVGTNAVQVALGMGAEVSVFDKRIPRLRQLADQFGSALKTVYATQEQVDEAVRHADVVIGAVLVTGALTPHLVSRAMLPEMQSGAVLVDVAIDQGGCFESSHPTTFSDPVYVESDILHYCVANMPGAVPRTSTRGLTHATLPFVLALANKGIKNACMEDPHLQNGLNICHGHITYAAVAEAMGQPLSDVAGCFK